MARSDTQARARLSFLDKILLEDDGVVAPSPSREMAILRAAVRRDLQALLNSRRWSKSWPKAAGELDSSVLAFGLPDIHTVPTATQNQQEMFRRTIEDTVRRFEPRFRSFEVTLLRNSEDLDRTLRFRIRAVLRADADGEPVTYDSRLDPALRAFVVTDVGHE
jgi:type VI secretion system protein ImpF